MQAKLPKFRPAFEKGTKVKVNLRHKGHFHIGEYLGRDILGAHLIGVLETTIPGIKIKPGKKYISIFHSTRSGFKPITEDTNEK